METLVIVHLVLIGVLFVVSNIRIKDDALS
jgi:hypothetical protein